jgi:hypothetical protein
MKTMCVLVLAMSGLIGGAAYGDGPKSYRVTLSDTHVGAAALGAGDYQVLIHSDGVKVQLMEIKSGNVIDVAATVQVGDEKFRSTEVHSQNVDGVQQLTEIRIGGTKLRVDFRKAS